ncbi:cobyrinate a,c-diamide synthase [Glycomyces sp. TRM65418]|uniref:cobyrinate a,c-diamide synthase n=1 Tax=Glycomyces sp. TRM65418 TaxID=2867006 RepID=UPI001CE6120B|nr:cobyrinate a,c-diamide synthase [Glycomyces sp. TRM65418]MCC3764548.1 cobyrinate a,c-diamide synthase [Glycomyces sp. TRM65418]QZD54215.1 cobyrinate a,c-diamide synthase [Glycomyces sp. TRM65418]
MVTLAPRVVVAGTRSGVGKTTVATGLMAALRARGLRVSGHKVGPDFIDPGYHALACGRAPRNLDAFMHGPDLIAPLFLHGTAGADVAVIEGAMGLFDGRAGTDEASTAHIARLLDAPVLLVVDASSQSRSVAAEVHGFASFDPSIRVAGVVLNRVASDRHEQMLREALAPLGIPVVGVLRRGERVAAPSRHLGLVPVAERRTEALDLVDALRRRVDEGVDMEAVVRMARSAPALDAERWRPPVHLGDVTRPVVAVAGGPAFTFVYTEHRELLEAAGAEVADFDPLRDEALPEGTGAAYLGGGFPEVYARELAANTGLADDLRALSASGGPIVAECGGLLYLCRSLDGRPMVGLVDAEAEFTDKLALGYRALRAASPGPLGPEGTPARGHEFHRTTVRPRAGAAPAWEFEDRAPEGFVVRNVHASYVHTAWAARPEMARCLVAYALAQEATA